MVAESGLFLGMNTTYEQAHSWALEWLESKGKKMSNEYVEYELNEGDFELIWFRKTSIELVEIQVFNFIIPATKEEFFTVLNVIDK
jgi:hypothetical protein